MTKARSNATAKAAKGDLTVGSGTNLSDVLAVGNNGETLVADSSTSTGLRYNANYTAGKNFAINGGFDIWQRGTTFTTANSGNAYNADRWTYYGGGTGTITQSTALLRDGAQYALRFTSTSATGNADIYQIMETPNTVQLQGKVITLSVYVAGTAGKTAQVVLGSSTVDNDGLFGSYTTLTASGTNSVTTTGSYQRITAQFTIPSTARTLRMGLTHGALASTEFISWAQVQLEVGSTATNFSRTGGTIQGELAACQRYCQRVASSPTSGSECFSMAFAVTSSTVRGVINLAVPMRTNPTVTASSGTNFFLTYINAGIGYYSTLTLVQGSPNTVCWAATLTAGSNTAGQAGGSDISATGTAGANSVILSAEL